MGGSLSERIMELFPRTELHFVTGQVEPVIARLPVVRVGKVSKRSSKRRANSKSRSRSPSLARSSTAFVAPSSFSRSGTGEFGGGRVSFKGNMGKQAQKQPTTTMGVVTSQSISGVAAPLAKVWMEAGRCCGLCAREGVEITQVGRVEVTQGIVRNGKVTKGIMRNFDENQHSIFLIAFCTHFRQCHKKKRMLNFSEVHHEV